MPLLLWLALMLLPAVGGAAGTGNGSGSGSIDPAPYQQGLEQGAQIYRLDSQHSQILVRVFKGGFLSAFGHNHLLALRDIEGWVMLAADSATSRADLRIPVAAIEVDNAALRSAAGDGFASKPSANDIAGTRKNMLSAGQLDGARHPAIAVSVRVQGWQPPSALLALELTVKGRPHALSVPAEVVLDGDTLRVNATLELSQQALGITPFSALGGTLKVADGLKLSVSLLAHRLPAR